MNWHTESTVKELFPPLSHREKPHCTQRHEKNMCPKQRCLLCVSPDKDIRCWGHKKREKAEENRNDH